MENRQTHVPHQQRVIDERDQLEVKLTTAIAFIDSPAFAELSKLDATLLNIQTKIMSDYLSILNKRISRF